MKWTTGITASCALLAAAIAFGASAPSAVLVRFEEGRLWVRCHSVPAPEVFSAIAQKTGVRFVIDSELKLGPLSLEVEGMQLERAIRSIIGDIGEAAGHTMFYARDQPGAPVLTEVAIYGPGKTLAGGTSAVYEAPTPSAAPPSFPTPDLQERLDRMVEAGVPRETAEKVISLTAEVQKLQATPEPGSYRPEDLSPASREQLQPLIDRGVPMERAVQMLLLQEKYQETLKELSNVPGGFNVPGLQMTPPPPDAMGEAVEGE